MHYNSNHNEYYDAYRRENFEETTKQKVLKFLLMFIALVLFVSSIFYLYQYFSVDISPQTPPKEQTKTLLIRESSLPKSIQFQERLEAKKEAHATTTSLNKKDIELIVKIIMLQMNQKAEKSLASQLNEVETKTFSQKSLEESNHYNKVILTDDIKENQNTPLVELTEQLDAISAEVDSLNSNYRSSIKKEIHFRENEMRIIVVQKGDTLSKIAKKAYGSYEDYRKIFTANPEIIKNPNQIFVGQRLRIPA